MKNKEQLKNEIIGAIVKSVNRTVKPIDEFWYDGLGMLFTYEFVLELDNGKLYQFDEEDLSVWDKDLKLVKIQSQHENEYVGQRIMDVMSDLVTGGLFFKLDNDMVLYHDTDFGSVLGVEVFKKMFNEKGELL